MTFQSIILGVVQGLTEFLPISSSAHLILIPWLLKWSDLGLTFDIALHCGTLLAVIIYFWKDCLKLISMGLKHPLSHEGQLFWFLAGASIPGAIAGLLLEKKAETLFRDPLLISSMLILMGILLFWADQRSIKKIEFKNITFKISLTIGFLQALAIIPGVSRSGITMTAGLFLGITREGSARFSFLLSIPIILGAALLKLSYVIHDPHLLNLDFFIGTLSSFISGFFAISFLLHYVQSKNFLPFCLYRLIVGLFMITVIIIRS